jgi:hypothetical protein
MPGLPHREVVAHRGAQFRLFGMLGRTVPGKTRGDK